MNKCRSKTYLKATLPTSEIIGTIGVSGSSVENDHTVEEAKALAV